MKSTMIVSIRESVGLRSPPLKYTTNCNVPKVNLDPIE